MIIEHETHLDGGLTNGVEARDGIGNVDSRSSTSASAAWTGGSARANRVLEPVEALEVVQRFNSAPSRKVLTLQVLSPSFWSVAQVYRGWPSHCNCI